MFDINNIDVIILTRENLCVGCTVRERDVEGTGCRVTVAGQTVTGEYCE